MFRQDRFVDLPDETRQHIYSYLPLRQRASIKRVGQPMHHGTFTNIRGLVFIRTNLEGQYSDLFVYFHFARHHRISVANNVQLESILRQVHGENEQLESVKFMSINFTPGNQAETQALQAIGNQVVGMRAIEFHRCTFSHYHQLQPIVSQTTTLVRFELDFVGPAGGMGQLVQNVLNHNPNIEHFKLRHPTGNYANLQISQRLTSFHISVPVANLHRNLWLSLRNHSGQSLRVFKSEFYHPEQEQNLVFKNLEDLRVGNLLHQPSQEVIPSRDAFPKLRVLTLRSEDIVEDMEDMTWLFTLHAHLRVLDIAIIFQNEMTIAVIAESCPQLQYLSMRVEFEFTNVGVHHLLQLTHLRYLHLNGNAGRITDEQLEQVVHLQHLRALRCECGVQQMPLSEESFTARAQADPNRLYFLQFSNTRPNEVGNLLRMNTSCRHFFFPWGDMSPFGLADYRQWEKIDRRMLR